VIFRSRDRHVEPFFQYRIHSPPKKTTDIGTLAWAGKWTESIHRCKMLTLAIEIENFLVTRPDGLFFDALGPSDFERIQERTWRNGSAQEPREELPGGTPTNIAC